MSVLKKYWNNKTKALVWGLAGLLLLITLIAAVTISGSDVCKTIVVSIKGNAQQFFITEKNVLYTINAANNIKQKPKADINLKQIEDKLLQNIWVDKADVYFSDKNTLQIDVQQREPLYRLFTLGGQSYYVDKRNRILPLSENFNTKLPVFTGYRYSVSGTVADSVLLAPLTQMAAFISNDEFWKAQIQQVEIVKNDFELVPTLGDHIILFGDTANMATKFNKLKKYYTKVAAVIGFDKFKFLNIQFKDQVVGSNQYINITDSVNVRRNVQLLLENETDTTQVAVADTLQPRNSTIANRSNQATSAQNAPQRRAVQASPAVRAAGATAPTTQRRTTVPTTTRPGANRQPTRPVSATPARPATRTTNNNRQQTNNNNNRIRRTN